MGKGDKRTKRGKIFRGSFGRCRPKKKKQNAVLQEQQPPVEQPALEKVRQE